MGHTSRQYFNKRVKCIRVSLSKSSAKDDNLLQLYVKELPQIYSINFIENILFFVIFKCFNYYYISCGRVS